MADDAALPEYSGVRALFNADLHTVEPDWAPREDWVVVTAREIRHEPSDGQG